MGMAVGALMVAMECGSEMMVVGGFDGRGVGGVGVWVVGVGCVHTQCDGHVLEYVY